jgi:CrcB protein
VILRLMMIGAGGFAGAVLRYLVSGVVQGFFRNTTFPVGTFLVNVSGCFAIGFLYHLSESRGFLTEAGRAFLLVGLLGGYTTFSAFGNESFILMKSRESLLALVNVAGQVTVGLAAVWLGRDLAHYIWR